MRTILAIRSLHMFLLLVGTAVMASCAEPSPPPPPFKPVANIKELMQGVLDPAADVVWGAVGSIVTKDGIEEIFPKNDEEWDAVWHGTVMLTEAGNLLMIGDRAKDTSDWMKMSQALIDAGVVAQKAAKAKDTEAVLAVGEQIFNACQNCHMKYWVTEGN